MQWNKPWVVPQALSSDAVTTGDSYRRATNIVTALVTIGNMSS